MARPKKSDAPDLTQAIDLTAGAIERLTCPVGKQQAFMRDSDTKGLRVRVTAADAKSFVYERKLDRQTIRRTIGEVSLWSIDQARIEARRLGVMLDSGTDPRELERQQKAATQAQATANAANALTVGEAWQRYCVERRPFWGDLNYKDHVNLVQTGGVERARRSGVLTKPGLLSEFMPLRLADLDAPTIEAWARRESKTRPARVRLGLRLLKAFLRWAASEPDLKGKADPTAASAKKTREFAGKAKPKNDYIQREQLPAWFDHVRQIPNPVISAYLQVLLLTGRRREEIAEMKWKDVNFQWRGIDMKDKMEGRAPMPLTPYVAHLLAGLPKRNEWVFASVLVLDPSEKNAERRARYHEEKGQAPPVGDVSTRSASGRLTDPSNAHRQACAAAGLVLTLHGLRRSFASLCEWLDIPGGISAQIQGHAPQGVREQNYIRRPLDLLRVHHEKIEAWILEQAGVKFDPKAEPGKLQLVAGRLQCVTLRDTLDHD
ncbi:MAG: integrase family protein [Rhodoferax sp.]|uniref:integrase family protein n=1 Tax=Rhodoferax sp. TaxID=50421 RepID=UPI0014011C14|nr:integrase family protein [Rhodoferax sp.]NDP40156.1 integrase family protein [Rhodoferax sp.]